MANMLLKECMLPEVRQTFIQAWAPIKALNNLSKDEVTSMWLG